MIFKDKPKYTFKNSQNKNIYCWETEKNIIFSLNKLDEENGKYKSINRNNTNEIMETISKLGLSKNISNNFILKEERPTQKSPFYNDIPELKESRMKINEKIYSRTSNKKSTGNKMNLDTLSFLAGTVDRMPVKKEEPSTYHPEEIFEDLKPKVLNEGKSDRIILGKTSVTAQSNGLYKIEVENIPPEETFHADLYKSIIGFLNDKLTDLKKRNPDVAAYEQSTEGELTGKAEGGEAGAGGEGEIDLGFEESPEAGAEAGAPPTSTVGEMGGEAVAGASGEGTVGLEKIEAPTI